MKYIKKVIPIVIVALCLFNIVFFTLKTENRIVLNKVDPGKVTAQVKFYEEKGQSTLGVYGEDFQVGDTIYLNGEPQETAFGNEGWMTCFVPAQYYEKKGSIIVQIKRLDSDNNVYETSNKLRVIVR